MNRKSFLQTLALFSTFGNMMKLNALNKMAASFENSILMPVLFLGHGSPMNAIEENEFVAGFRAIGKEIHKPNAILCISAHWETKGTFVTAMENPRTIHDFGGFPKALFDVQYPAKGSPELAKETKQLIHKVELGLDDKWGLDHGAWSVIKHLYPKADVPVVQLSIDYTKDAQYHYELGKELAVLRRKGVLIIGSGNMVHNLGMIAWDKMNVDDYGFDWALEARAKMKQFIMSHHHKEMIQYQKQGSAFQLAVPTPEHYMPLIYTLAMQGDNETIRIFNDKSVAGSLTN